MQPCPACEESYESLEELDVAMCDFASGHCGVVKKAEQALAAGKHPFWLDPGDDEVVCILSDPADHRWSISLREMAREV